MKRIIKILAIALVLCLFVPLVGCSEEQQEVVIENQKPAEPGKDSTKEHVVEITPGQEVEKNIKIRDCLNEIMNKMQSQNDTEFSYSVTYKSTSGQKTNFGTAFFYGNAFYTKGQDDSVYYKINKQGKINGLSEASLLYRDNKLVNKKFRTINSEYEVNDLYLLFKDLYKAELNDSSCVTNPDGYIAKVQFDYFWSALVNNFTFINNNWKFKPIQNTKAYAEMKLDNDFNLKSIKWSVASENGVQIDGEIKMIAMDYSSYPFDPTYYDQSSDTEFFNKYGIDPEYNPIQIN